MSLSVRLILGLALVATFNAGCQRRRDAGPVVVSVIGHAPVVGDPARGPLDPPSRALLAATAQGLVRLDGAGQVASGLAERWTVLDDGLSYIFRLREATWANGDPVRASEVVAALKRQIARNSRNPLAPYLSAIDDIVEMTPSVIEIRLKRPRPDLLRLFAQPELAVYRARGIGSGPFRVATRHPRWVMLHPAFDPLQAAAEDAVEPGPEQSVQFFGERAARAIVRFQAGESDMATGGDFNDWPLISQADITPANLRVETAAGLFGLAVANRTGFLADAQNRAAIAQAIDRGALVAAFAPDWKADEAILPDALDSLAAPAVPAWASLSPADRRSGARARIDRWRAAHPGPVTLRLALPHGPGANILFGFVGASLGAVGITLERVPEGAPADLRLIDAIAPYNSARWYLNVACQPCSQDAFGKILAARDAETLAERARALADADAALTADAAYIPIARPMRWSLVAVRLRGWTANQHGWHPFDDLRGEKP